MDAIEQLRRLGFGDYESRAYVALLERDGMNGYELARAAGVPRPNIYGVLQRLEERGAVLRAETSAGTRFSALPPEQLLRGLDEQFQDALTRAGTSLAGIESREWGDHAWNITGYSQAIQNARALLESAREGALIAIRVPEAEILSSSLEQSQERGLKLTTLCLQGCPEPCGHCRGHIHRYPVEAEETARWLVIVADGAEMLAAEVGPDQSTWAVRSRQPLLVDMATWYVQQTIVQSRLVEELKARTGGELDGGTLTLFAPIGPGGVATRFTRYFKRLARPGDDEVRKSAASGESKP